MKTFLITGYKKLNKLKLHNVFLRLNKQKLIKLIKVDKVLHSCRKLLFCVLYSSVINYIT